MSQQEYLKLIDLVVSDLVPNEEIFDGNGEIRIKLLAYLDSKYDTHCGNCGDELSTARQRLVGRCDECSKWDLFALKH